MTPEPDLRPVSTATRNAYTQACERYGRGEVERLRDGIAEREARLARIGDELRSVSRELYRSRRRLSAFEDVLSTERGRFERDFDEMASLPNVHGIEIDGTCIRVLTESVVVEHGGRDFRLGEFAIDIDLERGVRISNLRNTSKSSGWDHPHVQGTVPCLGNLQEACEILLGQLEIAPLVSLLMQFLETYSPSTAYGPITLWEELSE